MCWARISSPPSGSPLRSKRTSGSSATSSSGRCQKNTDDAATRTRSPRRFEFIPPINPTTRSIVMSVRRWTRSSVTPRRTQSGSDHPVLVTAKAAPAQRAVAGASLMRKLHLTHAAYAAMVGAALLGMIALIVAVARDAGPLPGDVGLTVWWQRLILPHSWLSRLLQIDSTVNWPRSAGILVATAIAVFVALSRWLDAALALATVATADATNFLINQIIQRPRPLGYGVYVDRYISGVYSFPSGHVEH